MSSAQMNKSRARPYHGRLGLNVSPNSEPCVPPSISICCNDKPSKRTVIECEDALGIPQRTDTKGWEGTTSAEYSVL